LYKASLSTQNRNFVFSPVLVFVASGTPDRSVHIVPFVLVAGFAIVIAKAGRFRVSLLFVGPCQRR
jgi:hypothetical protein